MPKAEFHLFGLFTREVELTHQQVILLVSLSVLWFCSQMNQWCSNLVTCLCGFKTSDCANYYFIPFHLV